MCSCKNIGCFSRIDGTGLEQYVTAAVVDWLCGDCLVRAREQLARGEAAHDALLTQLAADEARKLEVADAYADPDSDMSMAEWWRARKPSEARILKARGQLEQLPHETEAGVLDTVARAMEAKDQQ